MKGGRTIKNITLIFVGTGYKNKYQACVNIYDLCNNLIYQEKTYNGKITIQLKEKNFYRIEASSYGDIINKFVYINQGEYTFFFNKSIIKNNNRTIIFQLTDANYLNMPIEKGKMILWQKQ